LPVERPDGPLGNGGVGRFPRSLARHVCRAALVVLPAVVALLALAPAVTPAASPEPPAVVLNEVNCTGTDWVEVINRGDAQVSLTGWLLTDDALDRNPLRDSHRMRFGDSTVLAPGALLVVKQGEGGFPFGLSCGDDTLRLADAADTLVDAFTLPVLATGGMTFGRIPDGTGEWTPTLPTAGTGNVVATGGGDEDSAWLYDPLRVTEIDLEASDAALSQLGAVPDEYVDARITLRHGASTYGPYLVGLRLKGHSAFRPLSGKAAFKVKFGHAVSGQRFLGLKGLTLNNMVQDPSMIAEALSSLLAQAAGVPTARVGYAYVRLNSADYGLYANVENVDAVMAQRWFTGTKHLYEATYASDVSPGSMSEFEVDEGSSTDRADLEALSAADSGGAEGWWERMQPVADLVEMTRAWAVEHYMGQWDGYSVANHILLPNNYYLHSDSAGRFSLIPSGTDQTWLERPSFGVYGNGVLMRHCVADASCRQLYVDALRQLDANPKVAELAAQAHAIRAVIAPWRVLDPRREQSVWGGEAQAAVKLASVEARSAELAEWLASPSFSAAPLVPAGGGEPDEPSAAGTDATPAVTGAETTLTPIPITPSPATATVTAQPVVKPIIGKPTVSPRLRVGKTSTVIFRVTRSDTRRALLNGKMDCVPTIDGKMLTHGSTFKGGTATIRLTVPKAAKGKLLKVRLTIKLSGQAATRTDSFRVG
jgi:hypothetical protein